MSGMIYYSPGTKLGEVNDNTDEGIFGIVNAEFRAQMKSEPIPIGFRQDVKKGAAVIRSSVSGEVKDYAIEIQRVDHASLQKNKGMTIPAIPFLKIFQNKFPNYSVASAGHLRSVITNLRSESLS